MQGTPERPLSELGRIAYQSYWRSAIFEDLYHNFIINSGKIISLYGLFFEYNCIYINYN